MQTRKRAPLTDQSAAALAETFKLLGDTTRVRILDALSRSELCVQDLAALVGISESAVSHQLRLLRGLRVVRPRRDGRNIYYTLDDQHVELARGERTHHLAPVGRLQPAVQQPDPVAGELRLPEPLGLCLRRSGHAGLRRG